MKFVFVSNFLNHHQAPFCEEMLKLCDEFYFIATENGTSQGYQVSIEKDYLIDYKRNAQKAEELIKNADVVVFGSCPNSLIELRSKENKLFFIYSERFFKKGIWRRFIPRTRNAIINRVAKYKNNNLFVLCASAFLAYDLSFFGFPDSKCLKWGYFPDCRNVNLDDIQNKTDKTILWAGRMLDWKQPETVVKVAKRLKKDNIDFAVNIVGDGPQKDKVQKLIDKYKLKNKVNLLGSKSHEELMELMKQHEIFMFTSNSREGWGAVLNEAMANGCAVVANSVIGSVPFLINDGENGRVYYGDDIKQAYRAVKEILENPDLAIKYAKNAANFLTNDFNYKVAAERICEFSKEYIENGDIKQYESGILSKAQIIKNNWKG